MAIEVAEATARGARALLNLSPHHSTGAIVAEVEDTRDWEIGELRGRLVGTDIDGVNVEKVSDVCWELEPDYCLQVSDCDRSLRFEINWQTPQERANSLHKIDTMIATLSEFREALADEQRLYAERVERFKSKS